MNNFLKRLGWKCLDYLLIGGILAGGYQGCQYYCRSKTLYDVLIKKAEVYDFYDGETGYQERIYEFYLEGYEGCILDREKKFAEGQRFKEISFYSLPIPGACDRIEKYILEK